MSVSELSRLINSALTDQSLSIPFLQGEQDAYRRAADCADEALSGIRTVAAFNAAKIEAKKYNECLKNADAFGVKKSALTAATLGFVNFTVGQLKYDHL